MVKFENFVLTFCVPLTLPLSPWGRGWGEGKFQIFLIGIYLEIGNWDLEFIHYTLSSNSFCLPKRPEGLTMRVMMIASKATTIWKWDWI